ncbi:Zn-ribbon domain-containing OB-fold protein [Amycolatopsis rubida]|uniref:Zn-ribbon domain-containing OB-fold protein n=1 Tax=Amycolatopsis rubida TaxID=112413 RepID=UPI001AD817AE|nr:OB-fold domain-containing protein [Amycolatopsis rubida]
MIDDDGAAFWEAAGSGRLAVQRCGACETPRFPPRPMCPACRSRAVIWTTASGYGELWSFVVAHPPLLPEFARFAPYPVVVVELEDEPGLRVVGNVVAAPDAPINSVDPATLRIGLPVRAVFAEIAPGVVHPRWMPA